MLFKASVSLTRHAKGLILQSGLSPASSHIFICCVAAMASRVQLAVKAALLHEIAGIAGDLPNKPKHRVSLSKVT